MASYDTIAAGVAEAPRHSERQEVTDAPAHSSVPLEHVETQRDNDHLDEDGNPYLYNTVTGELRLLPAPTHDPRDPLNLPMWHKVTGILFLCFFGAMAAAAEIILGAMLPVFVLVYAHIDVRWIVVYTTFGGLKAGSDPLAQLQGLNPNIPIWNIYLLASLPVLMMGCANFILVPLAIAMGRRFIILACGVLAIAGACWAGASQSLGSHLGARCLQALGAGTVESLIPFILQDMVFVHQRNTAISVVFAIQGILIVGLGIATPYMIIYLSWRWVYFITAIAAGVFLIGVFFFVPETRWHRTQDELNGIPPPRLPPGYTQSPASASTRVPASDGTLTPKSDDVSRTGSGTVIDKRTSRGGKAWDGFLNTTKWGQEYNNPEPETKAWHEKRERDDRRDRKIREKVNRQEQKNAEKGVVSVEDWDGQYPARTWAYNLGFFHGGIHMRDGWDALIATLRTFFYPHIFFVTMLNSAMIAAALAAGYTVAPALLTAPYSWSFFHLGLCLIPIIIASICVGIFTGLFADNFANWMAKKRGRRVPENQVINLILPTVLALVGSIIFGLAGSNQGEYPWPVFLLGLGLMAFGFLGANTIGAVYVLESYPHLAGPALVNIASFRCLIAFVLSFRVSEWIADFGYFKTSMIFVAIMAFFALFIPVIYIFGTRWRRRWPANWAKKSSTHANF